MEKTPAPERFLGFSREYLDSLTMIITRDNARYSFFFCPPVIEFISQQLEQRATAREIVARACNNSREALPACWCRNECV